MPHRWISIGDDDLVVVILAEILSDESDDCEAILLICFVYDNWNSHGYGCEDEAKENCEVSFVAAATTAPFAASAHDFIPLPMMAPAFSSTVTIDLDATEARSRSTRRREER